MEKELVFVKLGGSLITDKTRPETPRREVILRLGVELRQVLATRSDLAALLGHGSGSFGHWHASRYGTREGVQGREAWVGFARVAASAARLNQFVTDALLETGVPVLAVRPSSSARCRDGVLEYLDMVPVLRALEELLVPLVHGDVAMDEVRGGTIVSTEELMAYMVDELGPRRILLLGETAGVLRKQERDGPEQEDVIPFITPDTVASIAPSLEGSHGPDVTGGMLGKVHQMLDLVQKHPGLQVHIISGLEPGLLPRVLLDPELAVGTRISSGAG